MVGAISAGILAFCLWWLYFGFLGEYDLTRTRTAFVWGYGHYFIYGTLTAIGGTWRPSSNRSAASGTENSAKPPWP